MSIFPPRRSDYWLCVMWVGLFYWVFAHGGTSSVDDIQYLKLAQEKGWMSLFYKNNDSYYPAARLFALWGYWGLRAFALLSVAVFAGFAIRNHGKVTGTLIACGVIVMLGNVRSPFASSVGMATHTHFVFMLIAIMALADGGRLTKRDGWLLGFFALISGLPGIVAPFFALRWKDRNYLFAGACLLAGLLAHIAIRLVLPADLTLVAGQDVKLLSRAASFDFSTWLAVLNSQSILSLFQNRQTTVDLYETGRYGKQFWLMFGASGFGWMLLLFGGGWRYVITVLGCSILCYAFSVPTVKSHMIPYPDHGHYLHWVTACLFVGLVLGLEKLRAPIRKEMAAVLHDAAPLLQQLFPRMQINRPEHMVDRVIVFALCAVGCLYLVLAHVFVPQESKKHPSLDNHMAILAKGTKTPGTNNEASYQKISPSDTTVIQLNADALSLITISHETDHGFEIKFSLTPRKVDELVELSRQPELGPVEIVYEGVVLASTVLQPGKKIKNIQVTDMNVDYAGKMLSSMPENKLTILFNIPAEQMKLTSVNPEENGKFTLRIELTDTKALALSSLSSAFAGRFFSLSIADVGVKGTMLTTPTNLLKMIELLGVSSNKAQLIESRVDSSEKALP